MASLKTFVDAVPQVFQNYHTSFVNILLILFTVGGEELFRHFAKFNCPCNQPASALYGVTFMFGPALVLFLVGLMINKWACQRFYVHETKQVEFKNAEEKKDEKSQTIIRIENAEAENGEEQLQIKQIKVRIENPETKCCTEKSFMLGSQIFSRAFVVPAAYIFIALMNGSYFKCILARQRCPKGLENWLMDNTMELGVTLSSMDNTTLIGSDSNNTTLIWSDDDLVRLSQIIGWGFLLFVLTIAAIGMGYNRCCSKLSVTQKKYLRLYHDAEKKELKKVMKEEAERKATMNVTAFFNKTNCMQEDWDSVDMMPLPLLPSGENGKLFSSPLDKWASKYPVVVTAAPQTEPANESQNKEQSNQGNPTEDQNVSVGETQNQEQSTSATQVQQSNTDKELAADPKTQGIVASGSQMQNDPLNESIFGTFQINMLKEFEKLNPSLIQFYKDDKKIRKIFSPHSSAAANEDLFGESWADFSPGPTSN